MMRQNFKIGLNFDFPCKVDEAEELEEAHLLSVGLSDSA
jgi:hypothetical protein